MKEEKKKSHNSEEYTYMPMHNNTPNIAHNYHHPLHKDTRVIEMNIVLYTQQMRTKRTRLCTAAISSKQLYRIAYWNCDESTANKPYNMKRDDRAKKKNTTTIHENTQIRLVKWTASSGHMVQFTWFIKNAHWLKLLYSKAVVRMIWNNMAINCSLTLHYDNKLVKWMADSSVSARNI